MQSQLSQKIDKNKPTVQLRQRPNTIKLYHQYHQYHCSGTSLVFKMSFFFSGRKCNDSFCDAIQQIVDKLEFRNVSSVLEATKTDAQITVQSIGLFILLFVLSRKHQSLHTCYAHVNVETGRNITFLSFLSFKSLHYFLYISAK